MGLIISTEGRCLRMLVGEEIFDQEQPPGFVLEQSPAPLTPVRTGRPVRLVVSKGEALARVPDLTGLSLRQSELMIQREGLTIGRVSRSYDLRGPLGVVSQRPHPGAELSRGAAVALLLREGHDLDEAIRLGKKLGDAVLGALNAASDEMAAASPDNVPWQARPALGIRYLEEHLPNAAFFLHPGEASHGDLGMITSSDVVLAVSNSGETPEILTILPLIKRLSVPLISMTGRTGSTLARAADAHLDVTVEKEACPLNLAPTASTTATLAMGDAMAVALLKSRGFTEKDFAFSHPGGRLGRRLLVRIEDVMRTGDAVPTVPPETPISEGLFEMTRKGLGMTAGPWWAIISGLLGIYTDGDLRRTLDTGHDLQTTPIREVMTRNVKTVASNMLAAEAVHLMETHAITALLVVDSGRVVGAFNVHDLLHAGVM